MSTDELINRAAGLFGMSPLSIRWGRGPAATLARWAVMYALRSSTEMSYAEIGEQFHRHHTTVLHGVQQAERRACTDLDYALALAALRC